MQQKHPWCLVKDTKDKKRPVNSEGKSISIQKSENHLTYAKAKEISKATRYNMGIIIGNGLCCVDIDDCLAAQGTIVDPLIREIVLQFKDCYMEKSVSGHGIHIFFWLTNEQIKILNQKNYKTKITLGQNKNSFEFYYKTNTRHIQYTGNEYKICAHSQYVMFYPWKALKCILDKYMQREVNMTEHTKQMYQRTVDESMSGQDAKMLYQLAYETNGDAKVMRALFLGPKGTKRKGDERKKLTSHTSYVHDSILHAIDLVNTNCGHSCNRKRKTKDMPYIVLGSRFFEAVENDREAFKRSKNLLYSFTRIVWAFSKVKADTANGGKNQYPYLCNYEPYLFLDRFELVQVLDCTSDKKAIKILDALSDLGYIEWKGVYDVKITLKKFYRKQQFYQVNAEMPYSPYEGYANIDKAIFEDFFIKKKCKCEKTDLLLYLYSISELCSYDELCMEMRKFHICCFGYWYDMSGNKITKRYDVSEKILASYLNLSRSSLCDQLKSLQNLRYLYFTQIGKEESRGIIITLCQFTYTCFKKYTSQHAILLHQGVHQTIRNNMKKRKYKYDLDMDFTIYNFKNQENPKDKPTAGQEVQTV